MILQNDSRLAEWYESAWSSGGPAKALPKVVIFNKRVQELSATLGGVIESCEVNVDVTVDPDTGVGTGSGTIIIADDCIVTDEEIGLILSTTSANHFNFVAPNLAPGHHTISVEVMTIASAAFLNGFFEVGDLTEAECTAAGGNFDAGTGICTIETTDTEALAFAIVDVGSLTVEAVRATNSPDGITIDLDAGKCYDSKGDEITCSP